MNNHPGLDQQVYLNDLLGSPADTSMSYANATSQASANMNIWSSSAPSSSQQPQNLDSDDETKMEHMWTVSLSGNGTGESRIEEMRLEATNTLSLESVNINTSNRHMDNNQPFPQSLNSSAFPWSFEQNVGYADTSNQTLEAGGSSSASETSSRRVGNFSEEGEGRPGDLLDGRRLSRKRKNIQGVPEHQLPSGSSTFFHQPEITEPITSHYDDAASLNICGHSEILSDSSPHAPLTSRGSNDAGILASDSRTAERSRRSVRIRINPATHDDTSPPSLWASGDANAVSTVESTSQQFPLSIQLSQSPESLPVISAASSENRFHVPVTLRSQDAQAENGASSSRIGSSPSNPIIVGERVTASSEETNDLSMLGNVGSDHPTFLPVSDTSQSATAPPNWDLCNASAVIPENIAPSSVTGSRSGVSHGPTVVPRENPPSQHRRRLSEIRQLLTSLGSSASGGQGINALQRSAPPATSVTSQDTERSSGAGIQGYRLEYIRSAMMIGSQRDNVPGIPAMRPLAASTSREQRSRMIFEIRHVLDLMRRGDDLQSEDVNLFDRYPYFGGADLLDRHRDMRLDVDNMSYEELLALEERIGDVSTGLSEETVLKRLKQRKYLLVTEEAPTEVEPCCICQEEYTDGQDLGIPDCEHEFHAECIKQWLMQKNTCPICKTTGLATNSEKEVNMQPLKVGEGEGFDE